MCSLTNDELRYLDKLVRAALPIDPFPAFRGQKTLEERLELSGKLLRLINPQPRRPE